MAITTSTPRSVYVHVPFCRHRCGYCNFTLVANRDHWIDRYLAAIEIEIRNDPWIKELSSIEIDTLFLGGGTPSHLTDTQLTTLFETLLRRFRLAENCEVSLEANPSDLNPNKLRLLTALGFNRISIGVQSFREDKLQFLERDHSPQQAKDAVALAVEQFKSVSVDLIFGTPGETIELWDDDLRHAVATQAQHVSTYGLTIEKGTSFWSRHEKGQFALPGNDSEADLFGHAMDQLNQDGIKQYEISNFSRIGHRCRHNEVYWQGLPFLAYGPGAARYVDGCRELNHRSVTRYLQQVEKGQSAISSIERLDAEQAAREALVFALRRIDGIESNQFTSLTGFTFRELASDSIERLIDLGLLNFDHGFLKLTRRGIMLFDSVAVELL